MLVRRPSRNEDLFGNLANLEIMTVRFRNKHVTICPLVPLPNFTECIDPERKSWWVTHWVDKMPVHFHEVLGGGGLFEVLGGRGSFSTFNAPWLRLWIRYTFISFSSDCEVTLRILRQYDIACDLFTERYVGWHQAMITITQWTNAGKKNGQRTCSV